MVPFMMHTTIEYIHCTQKDPPPSVQTKQSQTRTEMTFAILCNTSLLNMGVKGPSLGITMALQMPSEEKDSDGSSISSHDRDTSFVFTKENFRNPTLPTGLRVVEVLSH